ncbi:hypothetical protein HY407_03600 [Candidatus Gottesmanbacteria bacterium]|nr:hypothetical protein [Candidatus Gottesmanbacteria bacterium]
MKRRRFLWLIIAVLVIILSLSLTKIGNKKTYKEITGYSDGNYIYTCSKPIKARLEKIPGPLGAPEGKSYIPIDKEEAKLFCHSTAAIENEGKIKILQRPEVLDLISKYQYKDVTIKALEFKYIKDEGFVDRLLPAYKDKEIGCIIVLETPGEKRVYLEDEKLETFEELDYQTFLQSLDSVSDADRQLFIANLQ